MQRSLRSVLVGTFTLRFSTGLTGALLVYYLAKLPEHGGQEISAFELGLLAAAFFVAELVLSPVFGALSDRFGHHRVMQLGPVFGFVAVILTGLTTQLWVLGSTRVLEGASTAASVPSILGFIAMATAHDEVLRGKTSARFEAATIAGLGAGIAFAGPMWTVFGPVAFFLNAGIYVVSLLIYRYGVTAPDIPAPARPPGESGWRRYAKLLRRSQVWLLAPTWIAINAALGLYTSQTLFQLARKPDPRFSDQLLVGGFDPLLISAGLVVLGVVFFAGLWYWGNRFANMRRTTIILYGIGGGVLLVVGALLINHSQALGEVARIGGAVLAAVGLFVLAGATPAALGLLADISESFPDDRGAVMGLYSVFLAIGQIIGSVIGGAAADQWAFDGILFATLLLMGIAVVPLSRLRRYESQFVLSPALGPRHPVSGMQVGRIAALGALPDVLDGWELRDTRPVVVLSGGAAAMDAAALAEARRIVTAEILPAVTDAGAALVTGGTDSGVMRAAGEARRTSGGTFPLIGVVPSDLVDVPGTAGLQGPSTPVGPASKATPVLAQPDHSHLLAVPGTAWGDETSWMFALADGVAGERPVVTVVLNGGAVARAEIAESVRRGHRVIVVAGTGRLADEIAAAVAGGPPSGERGPDAALRESGLVEPVRYDAHGALRAALLEVLEQRRGGTSMPEATGGSVATPQPMSYEDEMRALIARLDVSDEQRRFLRSRWLDQVTYMGDRAGDAKRRYYGFRLATVIGGVVVPALVSISLAGQGRFDSNLDFGMRLLTFGVSAMIAITASVDGFFHFGDRWRHYRVNAERLKSEGWQYLTQTGGYRKATDPQQAFQGFAARVEEILRDDVEGFMSQVADSSPIEKHDIFTRL